jgi:hypothetical protein
MFVSMLEVVFFALKYIKIIYIFYFLKFIFDISTSKQLRNTRKKYFKEKEN